MSVYPAAADAAAAALVDSCCYCCCTAWIHLQQLLALLLLPQPLQLLLEQPLA
jgi:hypothetical protein